MSWIKRTPSDICFLGWLFLPAHPHSTPNIGSLCIVLPTLEFQSCFGTIATSSLQPSLCVHLCLCYDIGECLCRYAHLYMCTNTLVRSELRYNPSTWEVKAGRWGVQDQQLQLHIKPETSLGYTRHCQNKRKGKEKKKKPTKPMNVISRIVGGERKDFNSSWAFQYSHIRTHCIIV